MEYHRQAVAHRCRRLACLVALTMVLMTVFSQPLRADGFISVSDAHQATAQQGNFAPTMSQPIARSSNALPVGIPSMLAAGPANNFQQHAYPGMQVSHHGSAMPLGGSAMPQGGLAMRQGQVPQAGAFHPISAGGPPDYTPHGIAYDPHAFGPCVDPSCNICGDGGGHGSGHPYFKDGLWITAQRYDDHWVQVYTEALFFGREDSAGNIPITSDGIQGPILMSTDDVLLDDDELGARVSAAFDMFSNSFDLELSWFGGFQWSRDAEATSNTNSLYSIFSLFGTDPPQVGFEATDQATRQTLC